MNLFAPSPYRKWFIIGLCVQVVAAWYSVGYNHPDEHFQILEYANFKLGHSPANQLPWEFAEKCRPALQPFIAFCLFRSLDTLGLFNPFAANFILRLLMGIFTWWVTCRLLLLLLPQFTTEKGKRLYIWCSFFLWFVPYLGVRFSAENLSGLFFFLALSLLLQIQDLPSFKRIFRLIIAGLLLGFTVFIRLQMAFAFVGLGIWMLFIQKWVWREWIVLICFALIAIGISVLIDYWFYGTWVFTPLRYYYVNIVQHKAANFGEYPWWYYFSLFILSAVPPVSILLLILFFIGIRKKTLHLFSLVSISFLIGHLLIAHKEMRFLFPIEFAFIFLSCIGVDTLLKRYPAKSIYKWGLGICVSINLLLLAFRMFAPAQELVKYYQCIYDYTKKENTPLISFTKSPYNADGLEENFYKPENLNMQIIDTSKLSAFLAATGKPVLFLSPTIVPGPELTGYKTERIYSLFPEWILHYNFNHWQERSRIWVIYKIYPK